MIEYLYLWYTLNIKQDPFIWNAIIFVNLEVVSWYINILGGNFYIWYLFGFLKRLF